MTNSPLILGTLTELLNICILRKSIICKCNFDILCLCETHLTDNNVINIDGYVWFGHNRTVIHVHYRARRGSGGVGILVKYDFIEQYNIMCTEKMSHSKIVIFACYIPPEHSSRGRVTQSIFTYYIPVLICRDVKLD